MAGMDVEVPGTRGYAEVAARFTEISEEIAFDDIHAPVLSLLPAPPARVLDAGAGTGRDAGALEKRGYDVVAVEPTAAFRSIGRRLHAKPRIEWVADSLPSLRALAGRESSFDLVLCHGVWQHLDDDERGVAMRRVSEILRPGGLFALALRHGPVGAGTHYFEASASRTVSIAEACGFTVELRLENQPSAIPGKKVQWTRLALGKG